MVNLLENYWMLLLPTAVTGLTLLRMMHLLVQKKQSEKNPAPIVVRKRIE